MLELAGVCCRYGETLAVDAVSLRLEPGQIACLLGPSGSGKTSLLRAVAGFEPVSAGEIRLREQIVSRAGRCTAPERRGLGMVFQDYALFPHLTAAQNVGFGLHRLPRAQRQQRIDEQLAAVGLPDAGGRYPHELSGGQQQRIALARALAPGHDLLLFDEPFSGLDRALREQMSRELKILLRARGVTALMVTHDQHEAFALGDVIGVMRGGRLHQWATAHALYHQPADRFVADFVGEGSFLPGRMIDGQAAETELGIIAGSRATGLTAGVSVDVLLRPDDLVADAHGPIEATVIERAFRGAETLHTLRLASGRRALALLPSHHDHAVDAAVRLKLDAQHLVAFPEPGEQIM